MACLDAKTAKLMPGTEQIVALIDQAGDKLANTVCEAAERAVRGAPKTKPNAATDVVGGFRGTCHNCGEVGHRKADCKEEPKAPASESDRSGRSNKRGGRDKDKKSKPDMQCATCGVEDDHYTRKCPLQKCGGCCEEGHVIVDCKSKGREQKKQAKKASDSKYQTSGGRAQADEAAHGSGVENRRNS